MFTTSATAERSLLVTFDSEAMATGGIVLVAEAAFTALDLGDAKWGVGEPSVLGRLLTAAHTYVNNHHSMDARIESLTFLERSALNARILLKDSTGTVRLARECTRLGDVIEPALPQVHYTPRVRHAEPLTGISPCPAHL